MFFRDKNKRTVRYPGVQKKSKASLWISRFFYWLACFCFLGGVVYIFLLSELVRISDIKIEGTKEIESGRLKSELGAEISGKYFRMVPKNNIIIISKTRLVKFIIEKNRQIETVAIAKKFPDELIVKITERKRGLIHCSAGRCFVLDDLGRPFAKADFQENAFKESEMVCLFDDSGRFLEFGNAALDVDYIRYILDVRRAIENRSDAVLAGEIRTPQIASGDLRLKTGEGWQIFIDRKIAAEKTAESLRLILENKIEKKERNNLEYIDLRTENRVYYKYKNTQQEKESE